MFVIRMLMVPVLVLLINTTVAQNIYVVSKGSISFNSNAPNEIIKAASDNLQGILDIENKVFAFKIDMSSFQGFNSPLQKEHFNENYMESHIYPEALFSGKIIENVNLRENGNYQVRAKGKLDIHGISKERILYIDIIVKGDAIKAASDFKVLLSDHDIKIPRVVYDKLATEVNVNMSTSLQLRK